MATKKKQKTQKKTAKKKTTSKKKAVKKKPAVKKKAVKKKSASPKKATKKKVASKKKPRKPASSKPVRKTSHAGAKVARKTAQKLDPVIGRIRDKLVHSRSELLKLIRSAQAIERDVGEITFSNEIDLASSLEGREMMFQLSSRDHKEIKLIEDALVKIEKGTFGICESCSKKIGMKRLNILPLTTLCIECQESIEAN